MRFRDVLDRGKRSTSTTTRPETPFWAPNNGYGGGIYNSGSLTMTGGLGGQVVSNQALKDGGALYNAGGSLVATTSTTVDGAYSFSSVTDGDYYVVFGYPPGLTQYTFSPEDQGGNDAVDSDVDATGRTVTFTVAGSTYDFDAGLVPVG